jgi:agmatine/peptidylarginine deiminase
MLTAETSVNINNDAVLESITERTLIVLSAPSVNNELNAWNFTPIVDCMINFANIVNGKDEVAILVDAATLPYFDKKVPSNVLIEANMADIWVRDFAPVIPTKQVKFKFSPAYRKPTESEATDNDFKNWLSRIGLHCQETSDIILEGGNVVENTAGTMAIVTDRILKSNPSLTMASAKDSLKQLLGVNQVAIIKEIPNDTTGHADGLVMWAKNDRILLIKVAEPINTEIINELKSSFPNVDVIEVPNYVGTEVWEHYTTARNCYVNSIVTDNYIYMPTFNGEHDTEMLALFQSYTNKTVVPIPSENVCMMGGSWRCLSWQVKGTNKMKILQQQYNKHEKKI